MAHEEPHSTIGSQRVLMSQWDLNPGGEVNNYSSQPPKLRPKGRTLRYKIDTREMDLESGKKKKKKK
jgi:hypothetical protein